VKIPKDDIAGLRQIQG